MGKFHKAYDPVLERWVGAKALLLDGLGQQASSEAIEGFKQEGRFMAGLRHPTIPVVYGFGEIGGQLHLLMEFIEGMTLENYLQQHGMLVDPADAAGPRCLPLKEVLEIGSTLCDFLEYLHTPLASKGIIIYRDLKPSNVLITQDRFLYVVDFGITRSFKPGQQKDTAALGSWGYSPPEQFGKRQTDERSDLYSLGAVLHQCLTGLDPSESPFVFDPFSALGLPTQPPPELERLVLGLVESDMKKRPASAALVRQEIQGIQRRLGYI
jgi:serine/threonine protein kinase